MRVNEYIIAMSELTSYDTGEFVPSTTKEVRALIGLNGIKKDDHLTIGKSLLSRVAKGNPKQPCSAKYTKIRVKSITNAIEAYITITE